MSSPRAHSDLSPRDVNYRFLRLYSIDFDMARGALRLLAEEHSRSVQFALFRDFVVTYARPFSGNRAPSGSNDTLSSKHVPTASRPLHQALLDLRDQLFAHTDFEARDPRVARFDTSMGARFPMSFSNPDYLGWLNRLPELNELVEAVDASLAEHIRRIEEESHTSGGSNNAVG
jgi:hypothetical protein